MFIRKKKNRSGSVSVQIISKHKGFYKVIEDIIRFEPTGAYSRRLWFLWEWLQEEELDIEEILTKKISAGIWDRILIKI